MPGAPLYLSNEHVTGDVYIAHLRLTEILAFVTSCRFSRRRPHQIMDFTEHLVE